MLKKTFPVKKESAESIDLLLKLVYFCKKLVYDENNFDFNYLLGALYFL